MPNNAASNSFGTLGRITVAQCYVWPNQLLGFLLRLYINWSLEFAEFYKAATTIDIQRQGEK